MKRSILAALGVSLALGTVAAQAGKLGVFTAGEQGFDTHTFYYDDGKEVTLIDTQFVPALSEAMVKQIRSETQSPITRVIVTHPNPDKFNGLAYLHKLGVHSITSRAVAAALPEVHRYKQNFWVNTMKAFTDANYPKFENVQETFEGSRTIKLASGETLTLTELKHAGIASTQIVVRVDQSADLLVGDLVHHHAHAWLEGGLVNGKPQPALKEWIAALAELPALAAGYPNAKVYGGRGEFVPVAEAVAAEQAYLSKAGEIVDRYVVELGDKRKELNEPDSAAKHYAVLQQRFTAQFPEYRLPYMVGYSVYGLVQARNTQGL
jgi:glyoxylase-like metal-dependent hydrolase (beta-lactamase superfamily II)